MKVLISLSVLFALVSCGKKFEDRTQTKTNRSTQLCGKSSFCLQAETWSILSEKPLPKKVKVLVNDMEFINECTMPEINGTIERTYRNGTININSRLSLRKEFFDVDIFDCVEGFLFYSADYVDETIIQHPKEEGLVKIILRLRNY